MNRKIIVSAVMAMFLTTSGASFAQGKGDRDDRGRNDGQRGQQDRRDDNGRAQDHRGYGGRASADERRQGRGVGRNHEFYRGDRLPAEYRHRQYVVNDWRGHNLSAPPRGYQWVQSGGDYILIAVATGIIAQLLLGN
jgi:Ni/Co efflux regulator RcnB